jgi:hypothetical protein
VSTHVPVYCMHFEKERSVTGTGGEERLFGYSGVPVRAVRATCAGNTAPLSSASHVCSTVAFSSTIFSLKKTGVSLYPQNTVAFNI